MRRAAPVLLLALSLVAAGCTAGDGDQPRPATIEAHGGTGQIWVRTDPGAELALLDAAGEAVPFEAVDAKGASRRRSTATTDAKGALVLRGVEPDTGYVVARVEGDAARSERITVTAASDHPAAAFYEAQDLEEGYGYLTTRDGTELAVNVTLPGPAADGPYPTVVEYLGPDAGRPGEVPLASPRGIAATLGFATVGVSGRGTGCSGGAFALWEGTWATDGYDAIEVIASQPWVLHNSVGMVGVDDPATAMLAVAALGPPDLAAIAPMGAVDDVFRSSLAPGGVPNEAGIEAVAAREAAARPGASEWATKRISDGDRTCRANQALRGQNLVLARQLADQPFRPSSGTDGLAFAPIDQTDNITVPTFLVATWQDQRSAGHAADLAPALGNVQRAFISLLNGDANEGLTEASVLQRWAEFLQLYVAQQAPVTTSMQFVYPVVVGELLGEPGPVTDLPFPADRFPSGTSYDAALALYQSETRLRVLFDVGAAPFVGIGLPATAWEEPFGDFPPPEVLPTRWYLAEGGTLADTPPLTDDGAANTTDEYVSDPDARPEMALPPDQAVTDRLPALDWRAPATASSLAYVSPVLLSPVVMLGSASADLWISSSAPDTDLQVTLTEVRPDGRETFVQSGWLRASQRKLDERHATELRPVHTQLEADARPLRADRFTPVRVEIFPFAHAFRVGSRIRITISAPGGDAPTWRFATLPGTQDNTVARSLGRPSSVVLPVVPGAGIPTPSPPCPSLRGQPCRATQPTG